MKKAVPIIALCLLLFLTGCSGKSALPEPALQESLPVSDTTDESIEQTEVVFGDILDTHYKLENRVLYGKGENSFQTIGSDAFYNDWVEIASNVAAFDYNPSVLLYLTTDGQVFGKGLMEGGIMQIETDDNNSTLCLAQPALLFSDAAEISLGARFALARKADGTVWFWGESKNGQSTEVADQILSPIQIAEDAITIKAFLYNSAWIDKEHTLYICGDNSFGQIGNGEQGNGFPTTFKSNVPEPYAVLENALNVWTTEDRQTVFASTQDGTSYTWGGNQYTVPTPVAAQNIVQS